METLTGIRREVIDRVKPEVGTDELDVWTVSELEKWGYSDNTSCRTGHGEGITIHEGPALNARDFGTLESGMVINDGFFTWIRNKVTANREQLLNRVVASSHARVDTGDGPERVM